MPNYEPPGKGKATGSMVCGICSLVLGFPLVGLILGIIGLILSSQAKGEGYYGGMRTAGFVLSLIGLIFGGISLIGCIACGGVAACTGVLEEFM